MFIKKLKMVPKLMLKIQSLKIKYSMHLYLQSLQQDIWYRGTQATCTVHITIPIDTQYSLRVKDSVRTALVWARTHWVLILRLFGTAYRSHLQGSKIKSGGLLNPDMDNKEFNTAHCMIAQTSAVLITFTVEAWNRARIMCLHTRSNISPTAT